MLSNLFTRRDFSLRLVSVFPALGIARSAFGSSGAQMNSRVSSLGEISHSAEAIHQEVIFNASPKRVYDALTDAKQFTQVTLGIIKGAGPAEISSEVGGAFSCFGGIISGRHIEMVPDKRLVQAWRVSEWEPGVFSIVKFDLQEQGGQTKLIFDHTGFPTGKAEHLASGWKEHYWEPMKKYLA